MIELAIAGQARTAALRVTVPGGSANILSVDLGFALDNSRATHFGWPPSIRLADRIDVIFSGVREGLCGARFHTS